MLSPRQAGPEHQPSYTVPAPRPPEFPRQIISLSGITGPSPIRLNRPWGHGFDGPSIPISHTPQLPDFDRLSMPMTDPLGPGLPGHIPTSHQPAQFTDINVLTQSLSNMFQQQLAGVQQQIQTQIANQQTLMAQQMPLELTRQLQSHNVPGNIPTSPESPGMDPKSNVHSQTQLRLATQDNLCYSKVEQP